MRTGLLLLTCLFVLAAACSEDENTAPTTDTIVGEWNLAEVRIDGNVLPADSVDEGPKVIKFYTDNRGQMYFWDDGALDEIVSFVWDFAGGLLVITLEDEDPGSFPYTLSDNRLSFTDKDNRVWVFDRVQ